ncbi:hypothetical protein JTB14_000425 [Gonioctena quinquepunctata]|nr:hypothetical protein JTB14_000425 [Gonioctena quinquepunctata]
MARFLWKKYRSLGVVTALLIFYWTIRTQNYEHNTFVFLANVHPSKPWEFVADFSNMKYLNPTITDFNIIDESGDYNHWKYSAEYSEKLSHWPHSLNTAVAHFNVKGSPKKDSYFIQSSHKTCFLFGLYCLTSVSEFKFSHGNSSKGAACEEYIQYQCPTILSSFCRREVIYQRKAIMNNLFKKFSGTKL